MRLGADAYPGLNPAGWAGLRQLQRGLPTSTSIESGTSDRTLGYVFFDETPVRFNLPHSGI
jgi:hypothetical protein